MSIREIEKLLGHSLDDDQLDRDFSLERAQRADLGSHWRGEPMLFSAREKPVANDSRVTDKKADDPPYDI